MASEDACAPVFNFMFQKIIFFLAIVACLTPFVSPPIALALGLIMALTIGNPFLPETQKTTNYLLQISVVMLGFGMNLTNVIEAGKKGILFTVGTIFGTLIVGGLLGKLLKVEEKTSSLISSGTAICGGSAIAATAPAIRAGSNEISVSLGAIFILNSIALFVFPIVGHALGLTDNQFGIWAAIAIHDTSSVVGAAAKFGGEALPIAVTIKLARALWIVPVALLFAFLYRPKHGETKITEMMPWFIFLFILAILIRTYAPLSVQPSVFDSLVNIGRAGLTVTLFLIGASLTRETIKTIGFRPMLQSVLLWIMISLVSLYAVWNLV